MVKTRVTQADVRNYRRTDKKLRKNKMQNLFISAKHAEAISYALYAASYGDSTKDITAEANNFLNLKTV